MIRLSSFISLLLTSVAAPADVQTNTGGNIYIPPYTINNGQNIVIDSGNINPEHVDNSRDEIIKTISISRTYKGGSPWIKITGNAMTGWTNVLTTNIVNLSIASYQEKGMLTPPTLGNDSGNGYRMTAGLDIAHSTFIFTSVPLHNGSRTLNDGDFRTTASVSVIYN